MAIAAEFPDIDMLWSLRGPVESFTHHRGITHTFLGVPFEAALIVGGVWVWQRWRKRTWEGQPAHWGWLYLLAVVALLSHLLLDYTNNYGIRPFFPFDAHWYAWSIVFIFDPLLFAMLLVALTAPLLFGLIGSEVGARQERFRGRGWAVAGLVGVVAWWGFRSLEHGRALDLAQAQTVVAPVDQTLSQTPPVAQSTSQTEGTQLCLQT
jgi:inner membrane protein